MTPLTLLPGLAWLTPQPFVTTSGWLPAHTLLLSPLCSHRPYLLCLEHLPDPWKSSLKVSPAGSLLWFLGESELPSLDPLGLPLPPATHPPPLLVSV